MCLKGTRQWQERHGNSWNDRCTPHTCWYSWTHSAVSESTNATVHHHTERERDTHTHTHTREDGCMSESALTQITGRESTTHAPQKPQPRRTATPLISPHGVDFLVVQPPVCPTMRHAEKGADGLAAVQEYHGIAMFQELSAAAHSTHGEQWA